MILEARQLGARHAAERRALHGLGQRRLVADLGGALEARERRRPELLPEPLEQGLLLGVLGEQPGGALGARAALGGLELLTNYEH